MKDLTIIITAKNRRSTLPRCLEYYKGFTGRIILLDDSSTRWNLISGYDHVEYVYMPDTPWIDKKIHVLNSVTTPYVIWIPDDDFLFLHSIPVMVKFLNDNPDYVSVTGQDVGLYEERRLGDWAFTARTHLVHYWHWQKSFEYETYAYILEANMTAQLDDLEQRLWFYWTYFNCKVHSIIRTDVKLSIYRFMIDNPDLFAIRFFDKVWTFIAACQGKLAVLPVLSTARSRESKVMREAVVLKKGMQKETKSHLQFGTDFLNVDLSPLQELAGVSAKFMQEIHHNLSSQNYKLQAFAKLLDTYNLKSGPIQIDFAEGFPSVIGIASESSRNAINSQSKQTDCPENIYPVFKQESLEALGQMYSVIYKFPL